MVVSYLGVESNSDPLRSRLCSQALSHLSWASGVFYSFSFCFGTGSLRVALSLSSAGAQYAVWAGLELPKILLPLSPERLKACMTNHKVQALWGILVWFWGSWGFFLWETVLKEKRFILTHALRNVCQLPPLRRPEARLSLRDQVMDITAGLTAALNRGGRTRRTDKERGGGWGREYNRGTLHYLLPPSILVTFPLLCRKRLRMPEVHQGAISGQAGASLEPSAGPVL